MVDFDTAKTGVEQTGKIPSLAAILPLKVTGRHYGENLSRLDVLLSSLMHYANEDVFDDFVIVTPAAEFKLAEEYLRSWPELPIRVVNEAEPFEEFSRYTRPWQVRPWQRQQIIKLNAPSLTDADFVLTLDPDVIALQHFTKLSLLPGGHALLQPQARAIHDQWWRDSACLLGVPANLGARGMGVTPALLSREILLAVHERLTVRNRGRAWMDVLLTSYCDWTEYTLYLLTAEFFGLTDKYHVWCGGEGDESQPLQVKPDVSLWNTRRDPEDIAAGLDVLLTGSDPGIFGIVASGSATRAKWVSDAASQRFPVRHTASPTVPAPNPPSKLRELATSATRLAATRIFRLRNLIRDRATRQGNP